MMIVDFIDQRMHSVHFCILYHFMHPFSPVLESFWAKLTINVLCKSVNFLVGGGWEGLYLVNYLLFLLKLCFVKIDSSFFRI